MRMTRLNSLLALAFVAVAGSASAQFYLAGNLTNPDWSPGTATNFDGGTAGVAADLQVPAFASGTLTKTINGASGAVPNHSLTPGDLYYYKLATSGFGTTIPGTPAVVLRGPADPNTAIVFTARDSAASDGFLPNPSEGWLWSSATPLVFSAAPTPWKAVGNWQIPAGGSANYDYATGIAITDANVGTASDGILGTTVLTGLAPGSYAGLFIQDATFAPKLGTNGLDGGSDWSFSILSTSDTVQFIVDANTGRYKIDVQSAVVIPPGYYASLDTTAITFVAGELMTQVGANLWVKDFTVATAGYHYARVKKEDGTTFPNDANDVVAGATGPDGYPFKTTTPNQTVRLYLDRNTYADGLTPASDFIVVVNNDATHSVLNTFTEVQVVGALQSEILVGDASTGDWTPDDDGMNLTAGADGVYSKTFTPLFAGTGLEWKVLARTTEFTGTWGPAADESIQVGRGLTHHIPTGANQSGVALTVGAPVTFTADTKTGRVGMIAGSTPITPSRPAYLTSNTSVNDWTLF